LPDLDAMIGEELMTLQRLWVILNRHGHAEA
jgi:hypothetical protein